MNGHARRAVIETLTRREDRRACWKAGMGKLSCAIEGLHWTGLGGMISIPLKWYEMSTEIVKVHAGSKHLKYRQKKP
jgi:NO-binding membrane sensor protein with MHYT domain